MTLKLYGLVPMTFSSLEVISWVGEGVTVGLHVARLSPRVLDEYVGRRLVIDGEDSVGVPRASCSSSPWW